MPSLASHEPLEHLQTAPIESANPGDILATVFANQNGDPLPLNPTGGTAATQTYKVTLKKTLKRK